MQRAHTPRNVSSIFRDGYLGMGRRMFCFSDGVYLNGAELMRWETMETAPRDGTQVWLAFDCDTDEPEAVLCSWQSAAHFLEKRPYWGTGNIRHWVDLYACEPDFWMEQWQN